MSQSNCKKAMLAAGFLAIFMACLPGCEKKAVPTEEAAAEEVLAQPKRTRPSDNSDSVQDRPVAAFQDQLLELAFETACSIPAEPFIKDRCRAQETVVHACLELNLPARAARVADRIDNWLRGLCYADIAVCLVQTGGPPEQARKGLDLAEQIAAMDHGQPWRSDRIRARAAYAYDLLGDSQKAQSLSGAVTEAQSGMILENRAMALSGEQWNELVEQLDRTIAAKTFDPAKGALFAYAHLFDRFYDSEDRRKLAEEKIKASWELLPAFDRFDLLIQLVESANDHRDSAGAMELIHEAQGILDSHEWPLENALEMGSRLAVLRFRAGAGETAHAQVRQLRAQYETQGSSIEIYKQARSLLPLAEACRAIGDEPGALSVYRAAAQACRSNTNDKNRAGDVTAICCSMAVQAVEPDAELWSAIRRLTDGTSPQ